MLKGKKALITGASSGIGAAIALELATQGVELVLLGRDSTRLHDVATRCQETTLNVAYYSIDLCDDVALKALCEGINTLDILIHSAGVVKLSPLKEASMTDLDFHYKVNVRAPYYLSQLLLAKLEENLGHIVFINSGAGLKANATWGQYAMSKFALKALADSLRAESPVRVTSVYPGRTASPMQAHVYAMEGRNYDASVLPQAQDIAAQVIAALTLPKRVSVEDIMIRGG